MNTFNINELLTLTAAKGAVEKFKTNNHMDYNDAVINAYRNSERKPDFPVWISENPVFTRKAEWEEVAHALDHRNFNGATVYIRKDHGFDYRLGARLMELKTDGGSLYYYYYY